MPEILQDLKCDLRTKDEEAVFTTEVNRRDSLQYITNEWKIVPTASPYKVRLDEVPDKDSGVTVPSYSEVTSLPSQTGEFYVDWVYGYVYFHSSDAGKVVNPQYYGKGSLIDAADLNKITQELTLARNVTNRLHPSAQDTAQTTFKIATGTFIISQTEVSYLGNTNIRLATGGEYEVSAMNSGYYNKLLFTIDSAGLLKKYESTAASTAAGVTAPSTPPGEMPVCIVTVQDDGTASAGTINVIKDTDIKDIRLFLQAPQKEHRYLSVYYQGFVINGDLFFDSFYFGEAVKVDKILINTRAAPTGSDVTIALLKNGNLTGEAATLGQSAFSQATTLANETAYTSSDKLGLKITGADSSETAEGLSVHIYYYTT